MQTSLNENSNGATNHAADRYMANSDLHSALRLAKSRRAEAAQAVADAATCASGDKLDVQACEAQVRTLEQARTNFIAAAKPADALVADNDLQRMRIACEIAAAKAAASDALHASAVAALHATEEGVKQAAHAIRCAERAQLAAKFMKAMDHAERCAEDLEFFTGQGFNTKERLPPEVEAALARVPKLDWQNTPMNQLRGGTPSTERWERRLAELMADDGRG